jgi:tetratricopeptide (TPR) repeat protein
VRKKMCPKITWIFIIVFLFWFGCSKEEETSKIPITTKSKEALNDFLKGRELFENLQVQESRQYFENALEKDPDFAMARFYYAVCQASPKELFQEMRKAVAQVDKVSEGEKLWILSFQAGIDGLLLKQRDLNKQLCRAYPEDERAYAILGNYYYGLQLYQEAIEVYNKVIELNPDYAQAYNQLGYSYRFLEQYDKAEEALNKYIELIPNDPNPYDSFAELKMKIGEFKSSIEYYQKALELNPNFVPSHIGIATNYNFLGEYEKARHQLQTLLQLSRHDGERRQAHFAMAVSYLEEGNPDAALKELQTNYQIAQKTNDAASMAGDLITIGYILLEYGKHDQALKNYLASQDIVAQSDLDQGVKENFRRQNLYNMGKLALLKGNLESSKENVLDLMQEAQFVNNTFQIRLAHELEGMIALVENNYQKAIKELSQANQQNPYNLFRLSLAYRGAGDKEKTKEYLEKSLSHNTLNSISYAIVKQKAKDMFPQN